MSMNHQLFPNLTMKVNSRIAQWMKPDPRENGGKRRQVGDKCTFELEGTEDPVAKFVLHQQTRNHFSNTWTFDDVVNEVQMNI